MLKTDSADPPSTHRRTRSQTGCGRRGRLPQGEFEWSGRHSYQGAARREGGWLTWPLNPNPHQARRSGASFD